MEFKVGDIVSFGGLLGEVNSHSLRADNNYPLGVLFEDGDVVEFTLDGRFHISHTEPLLKLIERPKKKVKKTLTRYAVVYSDTRCGLMYNNREAADAEAALQPTDVQVVELKCEYEIEE